MPITLDPSSLAKQASKGSTFWLSLAHIFRSLDGFDVGSRKEQGRWQSGIVERLRGEDDREVPGKPLLCSPGTEAGPETAINASSHRELANQGRSSVRFGHEEVSYARTTTMGRRNT